MMISSLIYKGKVRHKRFHEKCHEFSYDLLMFCFDINLIETTFKPVKSISVERWNWFTFKRKNYLDHPSISLDESAREMVNQELGFYPKGKIFLLTQLACLGYCFNPISLYLVFKENSDQLEAVVIEVTNTPWGEKKNYVQNCQENKIKNLYTFEFEKKLHVSPFFSMNYQYKFRLKINDNQIALHMENIKNNERHFAATLSLQAVGPDDIQRVMSRHRLMTYKISAAIYWQAFLLWLKGVTFYAHPKKNKD